MEHVKHLSSQIKGKTYEEVVEYFDREYSAKTKRDQELFIVSYNMIKTKFNKLGALATRGTIFELGTGKPICLPFYKFFNFSQSMCFRGDFDKVKAIHRKEDGSLLKLYYYGRWHIASNNTLDAYGCPMLYFGESISLGKIFELAVVNYPDFSFDSLDKNHIHCLELTSPQNRVILKYEKPELHHLMSRDMKTLEEIDIDIGIPKPKLYKFDSMEQILDHATSLVEEEGYVIQYECNNRIKVKSEWYVENHYLGDCKVRYNKYYILRAILNETIDDLVGRYPEIQKVTDELIETLIRYEKECLSFFEENDLSIPVDQEKRADIFRSGKVNAIENQAVRAGISNMLTNKMTKPIDFVKKCTKKFIQTYCD